jgi:phosphoglycerate dehydrogenase-like enzyme
MYYSRNPKNCEAELVGLHELVSTSDVIFVAVPGSAGELFDAKTIEKTKQNALIVSISPMNVIDFTALLTRLKAGTIRAAIDWAAPSSEFEELPLHVWFNTNSHTAYNTAQALKQCSDMAIESLLNLLTTGEDQYLVNPEYKQYKTS